MCLMFIPAKLIGQGSAPVEITNRQKWNNFCMIGGTHAN